MTSPLPPSTETLLRRGVRDLLDGLGLGCLVMAGALPPGKADQAVVGVVTYDVGDPNLQAATGQTTIAVQITVRGSSHDGSDPLSDRRQVIHEALTWSGPVVVNTVIVSSSLRRLTSGPPVPDEQGRPTIFDTFDLSTSRRGLIAPVHSVT